MLLIALSCSDAGGGKGLEIVLGGATEIIVLPSEPRRSVEFSVSCGGKWAIDLSGDWLVAAPLSGEGTPEDGGRKIYLTAYVNEETIERQGIVKVVSDCDTVAVPVVQLPAGYSGGIRLRCPEESPVLPMDGGAVSMTVFADEDWTLSAPEWAVPDVRAGEAYKTAFVKIACGANDSGAERSGKVTVRTGSGWEESFTIRQSYKLQENLIASWTVGDNDFMTDWNSKNGNCWTYEGRIPADRPSGSSAEASWHSGDNVSATRTFIISSDLAGHWAVKPTWKNDYMQFDVPLDAVEEGDSLRFRAALQSNVSTVPKDWTVEILRESGWIEDNVVRISAMKTPYPVEAGLRITPELKLKGSISVRIRCCGTMSVGGEELSSPSSGSALRFVPYPSPDNDDVSISFVTLR
ncbi:MAG: BACON domain-containing carbohydrate-binding protein [Bacteroidales bacterium]|nr:BACON domain-containing carbohydrate-binding protein [Bacteroidales bacterium]